MQKINSFDVIIIGGSYAGLAAAMALGRALRKVLIIDAGDPCNKQTPQSHNFLTNDGKAPAVIASVARQQVSNYTSVKFMNGIATTAHKVADGFEVYVTTGEKFTAAKIILATGIEDIMPAIPGFAACWGISVLHCPYCHGYEVRHQPTGILANGDTAFELASLINNWTKDLTVFTNGEAMLTAQQKEKLQMHQIKIVENRIHHIGNSNGYIDSIVFNNGTGAAVKALYARLPFVQHSNIAENLGCALTPEGYISIDAAYKTTVPGVYACGDNASRMRTVANAVAMGTTAGIMVNKEMIEEAF